MGVIVSIWRELGFFWFRWGKKLRGPYTTESLAKKALQQYKKKKLGDTEPEWKKVL